ncbi:MAG: hypothetical protein J0M29_08355 [Chitinophagales bacterium]|nr:hypothetical protein [Chitinophagales bacterium]
MKHLTFTLSLLTFVFSAQAQNNSHITGSLQANGNFFFAADSVLGTAGIPQYDHQKFGAETWLSLNYSHNGLDAGVRFDMFNNSNLLNPNASYSDVGLGRWYIRKQIDKFEIAGGYLYDQIGSGIIYRSYEERTLMIDNALLGAQAGYKINDNWKVRAFTGRQKQQFSRYGTILRGGAIEGFIKPDSTKNFTLAPGAGIVGRTYTDETIDDAKFEVAGYFRDEQIELQYNTYAATIFNTLTAGDFTWYVEAAGKTKDVIYDPNAPRSILIGTEIDTVAGKLVNRKGYTVYTSVSYSKKGLGITLEAKRTKDFAFRQNPNALGIQGPINFLPPMAKQNTYRLTARFAPATQELGEQALQLDVRYKLNKKLSVGVNFSDIQFLDGTELYREITPEFTYKQKRKWQLIGGLQILKYNIFVYQGKDKYVDALTPYGEFLYKFSPRRSIRIEAQYLHTEDEFGSWVNGLVEVGLAPHWIFYASDMYKLKHGSLDPSLSPEKAKDKVKYDGTHFPSLGVVYSRKSNRVSLAYVKQVEGINCAGGICRLEPAFHGVRLTLNSSF